MLTRWFQVVSVVSALTGTWFLAFGLKVRPGMARSLERDLEVEKKGLISPSSVRQRPVFFWVGLVLVSVGAVIQVWLLLCA